MSYKSLLLTACIAFIGITTFAVDTPVPDLKDLVCTSRWLSVPESFDTTSVVQCKLLVKANPERFEPHALLAMALMTDKEFDSALDEFRLADKFSADVTDREVLASMPYEDVYVELEFKAEGKFKDFDHVSLEIREGEKFLLGYAPLKEKRSGSGSITVGFLADRTYLDNVTLTVVVGHPMDYAGYELRVKDFVERDKIR